MTLILLAFAAAMSLPHSGSRPRSVGSGKPLWRPRRVAGLLRSRRSFTNSARRNRADSSSPPGSRKRFQDTNPPLFPDLDDYDITISEPSSKSSSSKPAQEKQHRTEPLTEGAPTSNKEHSDDRRSSTIPKRDAKGIDCPHFDVCSGCSFKDHLEHVPIASAAKSFFEKELGYSPFHAHMSNAYGWRTQAKLAVRSTSSIARKDKNKVSNRRKSGNLEIGLFYAGSHQLVTIPDCYVHHPKINEAIRYVKAAAIACRISPYDERSRRGNLRYIQLAVQRHTGKVQLTLVWNDGGDGGGGGRSSSSSSSSSSTSSYSPVLNAFIRQLQRREGGGTIWHSVWINFNTMHSNAIFDFRKDSNLDAFERILAAIEPYIWPDARICELYGGIGTIGLQYMDKAEWLRSSDTSPFLSPCVNQILKELNRSSKKKSNKANSRATSTSSIASRAFFKSSDALSGLDAGQAVGADIMIVDPPRKGFEPGVLNKLINSKDPSTKGSRQN
eukprot:jgi/Bigna1/74332/fgenesh1_pg.28_\